MRSICLYFQVHQPLRLRTYRFFDIGGYHNYYDDYQNRTILRRIADKCYLPMNNLLLDLIKEYGSAFKVSFSISGIALDQFEMYAPDVLRSFKKLAATGNVEFVAETYSHSLASLKSKEEFVTQVKAHSERIEQLFGQTPTTFRNTELIYSDEIGAMVAELGFKTQLTEGAKHVLGWKSPNYIYCNAINPKLKVLLKNFQLSDDIAFRFSDRGWSEWPLTTEKYVKWLNKVDRKQETVNLFLDYETFGEHQWAENGIFDFMRALPGQILSHSKFTFNTPSELSEKLQPVSAIHVQYPISWADEERDLTAWIGNELQDDAIDYLYALEEMVNQCDDPEIKKDWRYLQASDHFYYMCTKWFSDGDVHRYFNPYSTPYEAYINFMNVITDFRMRVEEHISPGKYPDLTRIREEVADILQDQVKKVTTGTKKLKTEAKKAVKSSGIKDLSFEDIAGFSNAKVKKLLEKVDIDELAHALADAGDNVKNKILPNLSKRAKKRIDALEKDIRKTGKRTLKKYRQKIEDQLRKLDLD